MTENGTARRRLEEIPDETLNGKNDATIPDYMMWDFGFSEEPHANPDGRHYASGAPEDVGEDLV